MNEPFYASIKLVTGEEVLAQVAEDEMNGEAFFVLADAITIGEKVSFDDSKGVAISGLTPKMWMRYGGEDLNIVRKDHVITISEMDRFGVEFYMKALQSAKVSSPIKKAIPSKEHTGYLGSGKKSTNIDYLSRCWIKEI